MHPRNPYGQLDFASLAKVYEPLKPQYASPAILITSFSLSCHFEKSLKPTTLAKGINCTIDFRDSESQRRLTEAILFRDFELRVELPDNRLCPPVPNRLNYILWLQDIVRAHDEFVDRPNADLWSIDIGTGASAIYPLLGCRVDPNFKFIATELDDTSFSYAKRNVELNDLTDRIHLVKTTVDDSILLPLETNPTWCFEFTMCNPPFYGSVDEVVRSAEGKELPPNAVCTGAEVEMITPGGELAFVSRMVQESLRHTTRCRWYTSMLGKLSSVIELVKLLREHTISNYAITEFVQGQTRRWGIAWSFTDIHLPDCTARISNHALQPHLPQRNTFRQTFNLPRSSFTSAAGCPLSEQSVAALSQALSHIEDLTVEQRFPSPTAEVPETGDLVYLTVGATRNTWSRTARRRVLQQASPQEQGSQPVDVTDSRTATRSLFRSFVCGIKLYFPQNEETQGNVVFEVELVFQWIRGEDRAMFETFVHHVTKKMRTHLS